MAQEYTSRDVPEYLSLEDEKFAGKLVSSPQMDQIRSLFRSTFLSSANSSLTLPSIDLSPHSNGGLFFPSAAFPFSKEQDYLVYHAFHPPDPVPILHSGISREQTSVV